jgi:hypothetical protein
VVLTIHLEAVGIGRGLFKYPSVFYGFAHRAWSCVLVTLRGASGTAFQVLIPVALLPNLFQRGYQAQFFITFCKTFAASITRPALISDLLSRFPIIVAQRHLAIVI